MENKRNVWLLPTDKPSNITIRKRTGELVYDAEPFTHDEYDVISNQHNYITDNSEIKEGDWVLYGEETVMQVKSSYDNDVSGEDIWLGDCLNGLATNKDNCKKIILTTDQDLIKDGVQAIDDEFLKWFVKNPNCEFVKVENQYRVKSGTIQEHIDGIAGYEYYEYKIIIPKEEPKLLECYFTPSTNTSSSTICQNCGKEKMLHTIGESIKVSKSVIITKEEPKQEIWKDIPNYEGLYQVSNFGNVKSLERYVKGKVENRLQKENILSKRLVGNLGNQYYAVTLCNNKDRKQIKVSVLVAMSFLNHTPNGYVGFTVDHIDNNPLNNNVDNLQVITKRENSSKDRKGISKYTGVTFNKKSNKWRSQIWINGKNKTLGSFDDELEAHRAYQKELQQHLKS
jgi:hypothetical protein